MHISEQPDGQLDHTGWVEIYLTTYAHPHDANVAYGVPTVETLLPFRKAIHPVVSSNAHLVPPPPTSQV
jgi:hypothetical protein